MNKFEQALRILGIEEKAGPEGARRAYEAIIAQHGATMAPDVRKRVDAAWGLLRRGEVWARAFELQRQQNGLKPPVGPGGAEEEPKPRGGGRRVGGPTRPSERAQAATEPTPERSGLPAAAASPFPPVAAEPLQKLADRHKGVIDPQRLASAVAGAAKGALTQYISALIADGQIQAAGDAMLTTLDIMSKDHKLTWIDNRYFATMTLKMMSVNPAEIGLRVMQSHQQWREKTTDSRGKTDPTTAMRMHWIKDLASVGSELPIGFRDVCIQAALEGDSNRARQRAQSWAARRLAEAAAVRTLIEDKAPAIAQVLASELPAGKRRRKSGGKALSLGSLSMPTLPTLSLNRLNEMSIEEVAEEWEARKAGLAKAGIGLVVLLLVVTIVLSLDTEPMSKELTDAQTWVCDYAG